MTRRTRRNHTATFKSKVALAALKEDKTLAQLAEQFDLHPNQITEWKKPLFDSAVTVFESDKKSEPLDIKPLHAKIGQLTLENDFLEGALIKAGLLSAKR
jgi:transposase